MKMSVFLSAVFFIFFSGIAATFQLSPEGSQIEMDLSRYDQGQLGRIVSTWTLRGIQTFGDPVHEEITNRILGCDGEGNGCGKSNRYQRYAFIQAGVRWNDDPPFRFKNGFGNFKGCKPEATIRFVTYPQCWLNVFNYGKKLSEEGKLISDEYPLMMRSHFGDLQFLHSMASNANEDSTQTKARILTWAEFAWRVSLEEFRPSTKLNQIPVSGMSEIFSRNGWNINDIFRLGNPELQGSEHIAEVAYGSLLHIIEDSFALGHVDREFADGEDECPGINIVAPGKIKEFHSYNTQDTDKHALDDSRSAFTKHWAEPRPHVIDVGRKLHEFYKSKTSWDEVKPYIECIFALHDEVRKSSSGEKYHR